MKTEVGSGGGGGGGESEAKEEAGAKAPLSVDAFLSLEDAAAAEIDPQELLRNVAALTAIVRIKSRALLEASPADRAALTAEVGAAVAGLRRLNRLSHYRNRRIRLDVAEKRTAVEAEYLGLANLEAEIGHLEREAQRCLEFRSGTDALDLVSEEEFYANAPVEISEPEVTRSDPHRRKLAQLAWELEQRRALAAQLSAKEEELRSVQRSADGVKARLANLRPMLNSLAEAAKPLQEQLKMPLQERHKLIDGANLLPAPLYTAFLHLNTYKELGGWEAELEIVGDRDEAKAALRKGRKEAQEEQEDDDDQKDDDDGER